MHKFRDRLKKVSVTLTLAYFITFISGLAFTLSIPATVENASAQWQGYVWAGLLMFGGLMSASDLFTGRRGGELFGSPFIMAALGLWALALLWRAWHEPGISSAGTGLAWLLISFAVFIIARYLMLTREFKAAKAAPAQLG